MKITIELDTDLLNPAQKVSLACLTGDWQTGDGPKNESPVPIKRSEVSLKAGDKCVTRDGEEGAIVRRESAEISEWPFRLMPNRDTYCSDGKFYQGETHPEDIISINGRLIVEDGHE